MNEALVRAATVALLAGLLVVCVLRLEPTTSITHFLPSGEEDELGGLSRRLVESDLSRTMVLRIRGDGDRRAAADALAAALREHPEVAWVQSGASDSFAEALFHLYFPRRVYLASEDPEQGIPRMLEPEGLQRRAETLRSRLAGPTSSLFTRHAPADPLGLFAALVERAREAEPVAVQEDAAFVFVHTRASAFDSSRQAPVLEAIEAAFHRVAAEHGPGLTLEQSGVNRFAVASERSIRRDVNFISIVSLLGVGVLFLSFFRSVRSLALALLPTALGIAVASAVAAEAFAPVHGLTLGFGLALIGVAIDYPIHVINHHALDPQGATPRTTVARLRRSLLMGGGTTALAFGVLALSDFPGVDDMGAFAAIGVLAALGATLISLPSFMPREGRALSSGFQRAAAAALARGARRLAKHRGVAAALPVLLAAIAAVGLPQVRWEDDPAALSTPDPILVEEDRRVRAGAFGVDMDRLVVALAPSPEAALALNDRVYGRLEEAVAAGHLEGVQSLHALLWSEELQRRNLEALRSVQDLDARIDAAYTQAGFRAGVFEAFGEAVRHPQAPALRPEDLADSPLGRLLETALVPLGDDWAVITYLREVRSTAGIREALAGLDGAHFFDRDALLREIFAGYRLSTLRLVALGAGLIFATLLACYRRVRAALLVLLPSGLAPLTTLGLLGMLGIPVNLLAVVSLILVMGMGVDYGVFALECSRDPRRMAPTMLSLLVCCLTTIFVFGTLALSEHPALRSIGLTTGIGISLAFLVSPAVLALAGEGDV